jgi:hypothetical protein
MTQPYSVETENNGNGWSWIIGPNGYREGPIRYRWEAEDWAEEMNNGKPPPVEEQTRTNTDERHERD